MNDLHISNFAEMVIDKVLELMIRECGECERSGDFFDSVFGEMGVLVFKLLDFFMIKRDALGFSGTDGEC